MYRTMKNNFTIFFLVKALLFYLCFLFVPSSNFGFFSACAIFLLNLYLLIFRCWTSNEVKNESKQRKTSPVSVWIWWIDQLFLRRNSTILFHVSRLHSVLENDKNIATCKYLMKKLVVMKNKFQTKFLDVLGLWWIVIS
jgi:hypothetical protein